MTELPKIVVQCLQTATPAVHPDPDVITAFVEKSLRNREREEVVAHLAQCQVCRELVALSFPEPDMASPVARPVRRSWLAWPVLRWSALATCVVVVGAAVGLRYQLRRDSLTASINDRSEYPGAPPKTVQTTPAPQTAAAPVVAANLPQPSKSKPEMGALAKKAELTDQKAVGEAAAAKTKKAPVGSVVAGQLGSVPPQTEVVEVQNENVATSRDALDQTVPGRAKDASQVASAPAAMAASSVMTSQTMSRQTTAKAQPAVVTNGRALANFVGRSPRWTLSADGTLQRSLDSGLTWESIAVPGQSGFRALAADGMEIWVGGAKGALYHSSDAGQNWTQVQPAAGSEVLTGDIIEVQFTDRLHGTVTTSSQRKWVTTDAGQSWQKE